MELAKTHPQSGDRHDHDQEDSTPQAVAAAIRANTSTRSVCSICFRPGTRASGFVCACAVVSDLVAAAMTDFKINLRPNNLGYASDSYYATTAAYGQTARPLLKTNRRDENL
jgi:hypothetical protein